MCNVLNVNERIRINLEKILINLSKIYDDKQLFLEIQNFLDVVKKENYSLYKDIIGLGFIDRYSILIEKQKYDNLKEIEEQILKIFKEISNFNELENLFGDNPNILNYVLNGSVIFNHFNKKCKAKTLLQLDHEYITKFNKFYFFECYETFKSKTIDDIINIYEMNNDYSIDEKVLEIIELLDIQLIGNTKNYKNLLLKMIRVFYKWHKFTSLIYPNITFDSYERLVDLIENYNKEQIISNITNDSSLFEDLVKAFLYYKTNDFEINKNEINSIYEEIVDSKVKAKLKEV